MKSPYCICSIEEIRATGFEIIDGAAHCLACGKIDHLDLDQEAFSEILSQKSQFAHDKTHASQFVQIQTLPQTSTLAVVSLILVFFLPPIALVLAFIAGREIEMSRGQKTGNGLVIATKILGILGTIGMIVIIAVYIQASNQASVDLSSAAWQPMDPYTSSQLNSILNAP